MSNATDTEEMHCAVIGAIGAPLPESLLLQRRPRPRASEGCAVLQVLAAGVNPSDVSAALKGAFPYTKSGSIAGRDCCGVVVEGPAEVMGKVMWCSGGKDRGIAADGGLAEFTRIPVEALLPVPPNVSVAQAGVMGVPFITACVTVEKLQIKAGETVAVTGANGQVGRFILSLAKSRGARTVGIVRRDVAVPFADVVVVHAGGILTENLEASSVGSSIHAAVDTVGAHTEQVLDVLAHSGRLVLLAAPTADSSFPLHIRTFYRKNLTLHSTETMQYTSEQSAAFARSFLPLFEAGLCTGPELHTEVFSLDRVREAYDLVSKGCPSRVVVAPSGADALQN